MYGLGVARGMMTTARHLVRPPVTVEYPEHTRAIPRGARTNLVWFIDRCTGCSTCAQACPDGCILVETAPREDGSFLVQRYEIDFRLCMYCGLCTEACPYEAIQPGGPLDNVVRDPNDLHCNKETLTQQANAYLEQWGWTYPNGQPAPRQLIKPDTQRPHH